MARVDDYVNAKKIAVKALALESLEAIAGTSGFSITDGRTLTVPFLNRTYFVSYPDFVFNDADEPEKEVPIAEQILILHYIAAMSDIIPSGKWIAYREIPGAAFYFSAFVKRAADPAKKVFGENIAALNVAAPMINGKKIEEGDAGFEFSVFPKVPLRIIIWEGDEEFEASANILFDKTAGNFLSPEDAAWLAGMVVYRLAALGR
ncbi:MAG: DUF3786 domain-containing protein [Deltaproteobacteria bacterium]|nr:DUF3786 domain-containing protein [Deltaproteobacteria bacterium]